MPILPPDLRNADAEIVWEDIYRAGSPTTSGQPGMMLKRFTEALTPGRALELACGKGDDAVWLARQGWLVTAVDIAATALEYALANARRAGMEQRISFERHDLSKSLPEGRFDLITANFFHSPVEFPRAEVLARAAAAVASGGHLLIIDHGSRAPWSWSPAETTFPTAAETLASFRLDMTSWSAVFVNSVERLANGPDGQTATVSDNIIFLRRNPQEWP